MGKAVEVLSLAVLAPVAVFVGLKIGAWAGGFAGSASAGAILGGVLGGVGAFVELLRRARGTVGDGRRGRDG